MSVRACAVAVVARTGSRLRALLPAFILVAIAACAPQAHAQATYVQFPEPLSLAELTVLLRDRARVGPEQMAAIEPLHDAYLARMRALRLKEIEDFLKAWGSGNSPRLTRAEFNRMTAAHDQIMRELGVAEDELLLAAAARVDEASRAGVQRVRDHRERRRRAADPLRGSVPVAASFELSEIVLPMRLDPQARAEVDAVLQGYEQQLTSQLREYSALGTELGRAEAAVHEAPRKVPVHADSPAGAGEEDGTQREAATEVLTPQELELDRCDQRRRAKLAELDALHARAACAIAPLLPPAEQERFLAKLLRAGFPELGSSGLSQGTLFRLALELDDLPAQARERVQQLRAEWLAAELAALDLELRTTVQARSDGRTHWQFGNDHPGLAAVGDRREARARRLIQALADTVGGKRARKLALRLDEIWTKQAEEGAQQMASGEVMEQVHLGDRWMLLEYCWEQSEAAGQADDAPDSAETDSLSSSGLPPLAKQGVEAFRPFLELDAAQALVAATTLADAQRRWHEQVDPLEERYLQARQAQGPQEEDTPEARRWARLMDVDSHRAYRDHVVASVSADAHVFEQLRAALGSTAAGAIRALGAQRAIQTQDEWHFIGALTDALRALTQVDLPPAVRTQIVEASAAELDALAAALERGRTHDAECSLRMAEARRRVQDAADASDANETPETLAAYEAAAAEEDRLCGLIGSEREAHLEAAAAASGAAWKRMLAAAPEDAREALQEAYEEIAYPRIFLDPRAGARWCVRALQLPDLTEAQRNALESLRDRASREHRELSRKMVPRNWARLEPVVPMTQEQALELWAAERLTAGLAEFDRDEKSARVVAALRRILTEAQRTRLAGLDRYEELVLAARDR
ncbi:MAG: hypothetical protein U0625_10595 [Phycisphaerales bacterium]